MKICGLRNSKNPWHLSKQYILIYIVMVRGGRGVSRIVMPLLVGLELSGMLFSWLIFYIGQRTLYVCAYIFNGAGMIGDIILCILILREMTNVLCICEENKVPNTLNARIEFSLCVCVCVCVCVLKEITLYLWSLFYCH